MNIVKELRKKKGIQQKELAIAIGVSCPTVSGWESGKKDPSGERLKKLAEYFAVDELFILGYGLEKPNLFVPESPKISGKSETEQIVQHVLDAMGVIPAQTTPEITAVSSMMSKLPKDQQDQIVAIVKTFVEKNN